MADVLGWAHPDFLRTLKPESLAAGIAYIQQLEEVSRGEEDRS